MDVRSLPVLVNDYRQPEITDLTNNTLHNTAQCFRILDSDWSDQKHSLFVSAVQLNHRSISFL